MLRPEHHDIPIVSVGRCAALALESISRCCKSCIGMVLFPMPFRVLKIFDAIGFFQIIRQCSVEASLAFLSYRESAQIDWRAACCVGWLPYKGKTGDL